MKKLLPVLFALLLMGCAEQLAFVQEAITDRPNPVTPAMLYEVENSMIVAVTGLNVYKQLCIKKVIDVSCRDKVTKLQVYTRQAKPVLKNLRKFVKENDQVNAFVAYTTVKATLADLKRETPVIGVQ